MDIKKLEIFRAFLRRLERKIESNMKGESTCCGVTLGQCHTLLELNQAKKASQKELSKKLELDKSTMSRTVDKMLELGLLNSKSRKDDKRYQELSLSKKGQNKADEINGLCNAFYLKVFEKIPDELHETIISSVELLVGAIEESSREALQKGGANG